MIAGKAVKVTKAAVSAKSELYCPWNCIVPSGKVQRVSLFRRTLEVCRAQEIPLEPEPGGLQLTFIPGVPAFTAAGSLLGAPREESQLQ